MGHQKDIGLGNKKHINILLILSMIKLKDILKEVLSYNEIGHSSESFIWWWKNDGEEFHVHPTKKVLSHPVMGSDFEGRYDPQKKIISIVDMGLYRKNQGISDFSNTNLENVPDNLLRRLKFAFGDDTKIEAFYENKMP